MNITATPMTNWKMRHGQEEMIACFSQCIFLDVGLASSFTYAYYFKIIELRYVKDTASSIKYRDILSNKIYFCYK